MIEPRSLTASIPHLTGGDEPSRFSWRRPHGHQRGISSDSIIESANCQNSLTQELLRIKSSCVGIIEPISKGPCFIGPPASVERPLWDRETSVAKYAVEGTFTRGGRRPSPANSTGVTVGSRWRNGPIAISMGSRERTPISAARHDGDPLRAFCRGGPFGDCGSTLTLCRCLSRRALNPTGLPRLYHHGRVRHRAGTKGLGVSEDGSTSALAFDRPASVFNEAKVMGPVKAIAVRAGAITATARKVARGFAGRFRRVITGEGVDNRVSDAVQTSEHRSPLIALLAQGPWPLNGRFLRPSIARRNGNGGRTSVVNRATAMAVLPRR